MSAATSEISLAAAWGAGILAVYEYTEHLENAVRELDRAGFGPARLSIIGKEEMNDAHQLGFAVAGAQTRFWGRRGALWTRLAGEGAGVALAWVPFIGHVVAIGPVAGALVGERREADSGPQATSLTKMLTLVGMSGGQARTYEAAVRGGQLLLLVHGPAKSLIRARLLLDRRDPVQNRQF